MTIDQVLVFTENKGKVAEFYQMLSGIGMDSSIEVLDANAVPDEFRNPNETGDSFIENALIKAGAGASSTGLITLADDSGLLVDALDGAPGVRSKRFAQDAGWQAPEGAVDINSEQTRANNRRLLAELDDVPEELRTARFTCALALALPSDLILDEDRFLLADVELISTHPALPPDWHAIVAQGSVEGRILEDASGVHGFGYDPIFWSFDLQHSFGEASINDKSAVSHRGRALSNLWRGLLVGGIL